MKSFSLRSILIAFSLLTGIATTYGQTTVTLPTIPCATCNGPGSFATTAPACTSGLVGAPLTMSWGAATGATSYTIMIATDAALTTNLATYTLTSTTFSVPAIALKPSVTYYWTVVANSASGSTKATGSVCSFSTNTTWTGTSATGGFPNGSASQQQMLAGIAGGYFDCRTGDGTCASGDNIICNPKFEVISSGDLVAPNWMNSHESTGYAVDVVIPGKGAVNLIAAGAGLPGSGTTTGVQFGSHLVSNWTVNNNNFIQNLYLRNLGPGNANYQLKFWAKGTGTLNAVLNGGSYRIASVGVVGVSGATATITNTWTQYTLDLTVGVGAAATSFNIWSAANPAIFMTDIVLCKL